MEEEQLYNIWQIFSTYISNKDLTSAIEDFLNYLYEYEICDINELKAHAEDWDEETDEVFLKCIKRFIKENELDLDYED